MTKKAVKIYQSENSIEFDIGTFNVMQFTHNGLWVFAKASHGSNNYYGAELGLHGLHLFQVQACISILDKRAGMSNLRPESEKVHTTLIDYLTLVGCEIIPVQD